MPAAAEAVAAFLAAEADREFCPVTIGKRAGAIAAAHRAAFISNHRPTSSCREGSPASTLAVRASAWSRSAQRSSTCGPEIVDVFTADAEAQQSRGKMGLTGDRRAAFDGRFDARLVAWRMIRSERYIASARSSARRIAPTAITLGGRVLSIATVLPERGLALELISTYVGHPDTGTIATHLTLGPEGHPAQLRVEHHDHDALDPVEDPRACAYDHAHQLIDTLTTAGHQASVKLDERTFVALEAVE